MNKLPVTIYVPHGNSVEKNRAMRAFGATLIEHGQDFEAARDDNYGLLGHEVQAQVAPAAR